MSATCWSSHQRASDHVKDLHETFSVLRKYKLKLNSAKCMLGTCVFGMTLGKFLEFLITSRGIEVNLEKTEAIINMNETQTIRDIQ